MENSSNQQSKRHCMVVHAYYPLAETRVQRQAEALIKHGYEVDVICLRGRQETAEEIHQGVHVHRVPVHLTRGTGVGAQLLNYLHFFIVAMIYLGRLHHHHPYQSVQCHNLPDFLIFCTFFLKMRGVPVILDIHDLMPEFFSARTGKPMEHWLVRLVAWQERISCRFADHVITVTELWRQTLVERGMPKYKTSVVMNVADEHIFHRDPARLEVYQNGTSNNGGFHIVYHGTQTHRYGIDLILHAAKRLRDQIPGMRLTLHGNGGYNDRLMEIADELELNDIVKFSTAFISLEELMEIIGSADLSIVPYRRDVFSDGILPTKLMEYVAVGVPVIVARTPVIETYFDETMVEYFTSENIDELVDCILKLYHDPARRAALVKNSDTFNQQYNWTKLSAEYASLIGRLGGDKS